MYPVILTAVSRATVETVATAGLSLAGIYLLLGLLFYVAFVTRGVARVDDAVAGSPKAFYLLILPGTLAFWPVLLRRWLQANSSERHD
ncbi:hypothetical protein GCM10023187_46100 [Nibrella viscosa]|uniref:Uncharacterized protein n=1 Tax=Nibrella viscosa TaxID=1084524 RepID=A0ABP8KTW6_9BACT